MLDILYQFIRVPWWWKQNQSSTL